MAVGASCTWVVEKLCIKMYPPYRQPPMTAFHFRWLTWDWPDTSCCFSFLFFGPAGMLELYPVLLYNHENPESWILAERIVETRMKQSVWVMLSLFFWWMPWNILMSFNFTDPPKLFEIGTGKNIIKVKARSKRRREEGWWVKPWTSFSCNCTSLKL